MYSPAQSCATDTWHPKARHPAPPIPGTRDQAPHAVFATLALTLLAPLEAEAIAAALRRAEAAATDVVVLEAHGTGTQEPVKGVSDL